MVPLHFAISPAATPYMDDGVFGDAVWRVPPTVRQAVLRRDIETCRFCGFRSGKYQSAVWLDHTLRDIDEVVTSCAFCEQVRRVDVVPLQRSGVLVWLPEVSQAQLNRAMFTVYALRISQGRRASQARAVLDRLMARRQVARERFGSDDPAALTARLRDRAGVTGDARPPEAETNGLRLLPLDRRIVREAGLEFNQFPQMLAYWRSKDGPLGRDALRDSGTLDEFDFALSGV
jgi:intracellular multiplication protein IcmJ